MNNDGALQYFSSEPEGTWLEMCLNLAKRLAELTPEVRKNILPLIHSAVDKNSEAGLVMVLGVLVGYMYAKGDITE